MAGPRPQVRPSARRQRAPADRSNRTVGRVSRLDADFYLPVHVRHIFSQLRVERPEKVGDEETYLLLGENPGEPPVRLYLSRQSGLLVRLVRYVETPLGRNPIQIDYADYRDAEGVKVPFRWTLARPGGRFTIQVDQIQQNLPIDDAKFAKPPEPPARALKFTSP